MEHYQIKLLQTLGLFLIMVTIRWIIRKVIVKRLKLMDFSVGREKITHKAINILYVVIFSASTAGIWGLEGSKIFAFITSVLTILGVGFFAQWSLLSNITSGIILYFNHPLKIGDHISIIDKDFPLIGRVEDISLFFLHIRDKDGVVFTIPNTVVIQKTLTISKEVIEDEKEERED